MFEHTPSLKSPTKTFRLRSDDDLGGASEQKNDPQIVIDESELQRHLAEGWFFVATLPSGKIVVGRYE